MNHSQSQSASAKKAAWRCAHCKSALQVRSSKNVSDLLRKIYLQCSDPECGASFSVSAEIDRQLSPSGKPDPDTQMIMDQLQANYESRLQRQSQKPRAPFFGVSQGPAAKPKHTLDRR